MHNRHCPEDDAIGRVFHDPDGSGYGLSVNRGLSGDNLTNREMLVDFGHGPQRKPLQSDVPQSTLSPGISLDSCFQMSKLLISLGKCRLG